MPQRSDPMSGFSVERAALRLLLYVVAAMAAAAGLVGQLGEASKGPAWIVFAVALSGLAASAGR